MELASGNRHDAQPAGAGSGRFPTRSAMLAALALAGLYLLGRNYGLNPAIFADEWNYSKMARLVPLQDAIVPSYLYLWLFGATRACGAHFLDCARAANVVLFLAAAPLVYLVARMVAGKAPAAVLAVLSALAPLSAYTAYFMPEATYYFGFWVLSWIALARGDWGCTRQALAAGAVLGAMSLVKVHALFLLPGLCLYLAYACWQRALPWLAGGVRAAMLAALAMLAVKFGLGYLLAGDAALSLFGPFYAGAVSSAGRRPVLALLADALVNAQGHLMALAILFALPLAVLAYGLVRHGRADPGPRQLLHLYTLLMLGCALAMTVLFTASLAAPGNEEGLRLHMRYYSFLFPLLWIVAAAAFGTTPPARDAGLCRGIALLLLALLAAALARLPAYALNPVDAVEVYALRLPQWSGVALLGLQALVLLAWAVRSRWAVPLYLYLAMPAMLAAGLATANGYVRLHVDEQPADLAGKFAHGYVPASERGQIVVAGTDLSQLMRAQFHIDHKDSVVLELAPGQPLARDQIPAEKKWLLVIGPHALPGDLKPVVARPQFVLVEADTTRRAVGRALLSAPFGSGLVAAAEGLSDAEPWGRWSDAKQVVLYFSAPLPAHVRVTLTARAFAHNADQPFTMRVGGAAKAFRLSREQQRIGLAFDTDGRQRTLAIDVPHPVSPSELGQSGDQRKLGIGIAVVEIGSGDGPGQ